MYQTEQLLRSTVEILRRTLFELRVSNHTAPLIHRLRTLSLEIAVSARRGAEDDLERALLSYCATLSMLNELSAQPRETLRELLALAHVGLAARKPATLDPIETETARYVVAAG